MPDDFSSKVSAWLAECAKPRPACPVAPLSAGSADELWAQLGAIGVDRERLTLSISRVVSANPRAPDLERLLLYSAAAATIAEGSLHTSLARRWNDPSRTAWQMLEALPGLTRRYCCLAVDDLCDDDPTYLLLQSNLSKLHGGNLHHRCDGAFASPELPERVELAAAYRHSAEVRERLVARKQYEEGQRAREEEERRIHFENQKLSAMTPLEHALKALTDRIGALEKQKAQTPPPPPTGVSL